MGPTAWLDKRIALAVDRANTVARQDVVDLKRTVEKIPEDFARLVETRLESFIPRFMRTGRLREPEERRQ